MSGILKLGSTTFGTENNGKIDLTNVGESEYSSTNHTWTLKAVDAPIVGTNYSTNNDPNSGQLAIYNGATKLWGINESGWVQNPNVPHFHVEKNDTTSYSTGGEIVFNVSVLDNTNSYNITTGRFTAPISGTYFLAFYGLKRDVNYINGGFAKNGSQYRCNQFYQTHAASSEQNMVHISILMELSVGDFASVRLNAIADGDFYFGQNKHNGFLGYLIG